MDNLSNYIRNIEESEETQKLESQLKKIKDYPGNDFAGLLKISKFTKKEFYEGFLDLSPIDQQTIIDSLKQEPKVHAHYKHSLNLWKNLDKEIKKAVLCEAYDLIMKS